jgi:hypothetical protein
VLAQHFCYWLQGAIELGNLAQPLTLEQKETIMKHVSLVVPSRKPAYELLPADALVFRIKMLNESAVEWELAAEKVGRAADRVATYYDDKKLREESK